MENNKLTKFAIFSGITGTVLMTTSVIPFFGWIAGGFGSVLLGICIRKIEKVYSVRLMKYFIPSVISFLAGMILFSLSSTTFSKHVFLLYLATAYLFFLLSAIAGYKLTEKLADVTGIGSFRTAGVLYLAGGLFSILITGFVVIFSASGVFAVSLWQIRKVGKPTAHKPQS